MTFHRNLRLSVAALLLAVLAAAPAGAGIFGTACQEEFADSSLGSLYWVWERCSAFNQEMSQTEWKRFYYNLKGDNWWLHDATHDPSGYDGGTLDNVDLFYINTHGGAWDTSSVWSMYDVGQRAYSFLMRLGDESRQLSVFAAYACETMKSSDGKIWTRLGPMFRGGLRYATGSHDTVYDSPSTDEVACATGRAACVDTCWFIARSYSCVAVRPSRCRCVNARASPSSPIPFVVTVMTTASASLLLQAASAAAGGQPLRRQDHVPRSIRRKSRDISSARSAGTATKISVAPMSIPAASGLMTGMGSAYCLTSLPSFSRYSMVFVVSRP